MVRKIYTIDDHKLNFDNNGRVLYTINLVGRLTNWTAADIEKITDEKIREGVEEQVPNVIRESDEVKEAIKDDVRDLIPDAIRESDEVKEIIRENVDESVPETIRESDEVREIIKADVNECIPEAIRESEEVKEIIKENVDEQVPEIIRESEEVKEIIENIVEEKIDFDKELKIRHISGYDINDDEEYTLNIDKLWPNSGMATE